MPVTRTYGMLWLIDLIELQGAYCFSETSLSSGHVIIDNQQESRESILPRPNTACTSNNNDFLEERSSCFVEQNCKILDYFKNEWNRQNLQCYFS